LYDLLALMNGYAALPEYFGWAVVVGLGGERSYQCSMHTLNCSRRTAIFAVCVSCIQWIQRSKIERNTPTLSASDHFGSAGHNMSSGWMACHIISSWTWVSFTVPANSTRRSIFEHARFKQSIRACGESAACTLPFLDLLRDSECSAQ
jgi:hypothetical protein